MGDTGHYPVHHARTTSSPEASTRPLLPDLTPGRPDQRPKRTHEDPLVSTVRTPQARPLVAREHAEHEAEVNAEREAKLKAEHPQGPSGAYPQPPLTPPGGAPITLGLSSRPSPVWGGCPPPTPPRERNTWPVFPTFSYDLTLAPAAISALFLPPLPQPRGGAVDVNGPAREARLRAEALAAAAAKPKDPAEGADTPSPRAPAEEGGNPCPRTRKPLFFLASRFQPHLHLRPLLRGLIRDRGSTCRRCPT